MTHPSNENDAAPAREEFLKDNAESDTSVTPVATDAPEVSEATVTSDSSPDRNVILLMAALIVLAGLASVIMLFSSSTGWMKIAVLAALWAAVIGAVLVTKYRRQLTNERRRLADVEQMHQLELDRELATHREQELILEQNYLDSIDGEKDDTLSQLRAEIVALREQLSELLGESFDEERVALRARAERLRELDSPQQQSPLKDPVSNNRPEPRAAAYRTQATANGTIGVHTAHGGSAPEEPAQEAEGIPEPVKNNRTWQDDQGTIQLPTVDVDEVEQPTGSPNLHTSGPAISRRKDSALNTGSFRAVKWQETPAESEMSEHMEPDSLHADAETATVETKGETGDAAHGAHEAASRHGRRRREDNSGGLTVAELLAQMRNKDN